MTKMSFFEENAEYSSDETEQGTNVNETISVVVKRDGDEIVSRSLISDKSKIVIVINNQFTSSPNTTQIASGAGRNSAAGNNAALDSSNTEQQQSVGAGGEAKNFGMNGNQSEPHVKHGHCDNDSELVIVINNQINQAGEEAGATQVASGAGKDSTAGTNAAIESSNTKQQHAVGGGEGIAVNDGENGNQEEV
ncbi:hypothetical protein ACFFHH_12930 [Cytobacillus solani]|uniref:hypothetical protein n=1 Tax=Cytobacillus solani TaxID=1637975 RepID=UPI001E46B370|nr:hypothetical protein [Cytobacillus solani]USK56274.1 hypothetical protein LIS82_07290 [Cytobacillus solani]